MTDPEELRNRAASIFERLRQSGAVTEPDPGDHPSGDDPTGSAAAADPAPGAGLPPGSPRSSTGRAPGSASVESPPEAGSAAAAEPLGSSPDG